MFALIQPRLSSWFETTFDIWTLCSSYMCVDQFDLRSIVHPAIAMIHHTTMITILHSSLYNSSLCALSYAPLYTLKRFLLHCLLDLQCVLPLNLSFLLDLKQLLLYEPCVIPTCMWINLTYVPLPGEARRKKMLARGPVFSGFNGPQYFVITISVNDAMHNKHYYYHAAIRTFSMVGFFCKWWRFPPYKGSNKKKLFF